MFLEQVSQDNQTQAMWIIIGICAAFLIALIAVIIFNKKDANKTNAYKIKKMVTMAIFSALSILLYLTLKFSLPFFPPFLKINFSMLPLLLGTFLLGPIEGLIMVLVRTLVVLPASGSMFVGEISDLIISTAVILVAGIMYQNHKTKKGAITAIIAAAITWIVVGLISNWLIVIPLYIYLFFNGSAEPLIAMLSIIPNVNESNYMWKYLLIGVLPFNTLLATTVSLITFLVYKRLSSLFHKGIDSNKDMNN